MSGSGARGGQSRIGSRAARAREAEALLCTTANGIAARCGCCGRVEVTLGNAVLFLELEDLDSVLEVIETFGVDHAPEPLPRERPFIIRTELDQAAFAFSLGEVLELRTLVSTARQRMRPAGATISLPLGPRRHLN